MANRRKVCHCLLASSAKAPGTPAPSGRRATRRSWGVGPAVVRGRAGCQRSTGIVARLLVSSPAVPPVAEVARRLPRFGVPGPPSFRNRARSWTEGVPPRPSSFGVSPMSEVTRILSAAEQGDPHAPEQLLPLVYDELRKLAAERLAREKPGQTLQATALVHEAYLRLVDVERAQHWSSRGHFFAAAAEAMRRILVDQARRERA